MNVASRTIQDLMGLLHQGVSEPHRRDTNQLWSFPNPHKRIAGTLKDDKYWQHECS